MKHDSMLKNLTKLDFIFLVLLASVFVLILKLMYCLETDEVKRESFITKAKQIYASEILIVLW